jgi:hypothetical protein
MMTLQNNSQKLRFDADDVKARRVLNIGSGPKSIRKANALFDPAGWQEIRMDVDPAVRPDVVGSMTDMHIHIRTQRIDAVWS